MTETHEIPVIPNIDAAIEDAINAGGVLQMCNWHGNNDDWCGTTHCRAGWAIHLAGEKGRELEIQVGTDEAAMLIYKASRPDRHYEPDFYCSNDLSWEDIQKCAAEQRAHCDD